MMNNDHHAKQFFDPRTVGYSSRLSSGLLPLPARLLLIGASQLSLADLARYERKAGAGQSLNVSLWDYPPDIVTSWETSHG